jgi:hypothetical protein
VKLLLDEMYPATLAAGLKAAGIEAITVAPVGLGGRSDAESQLDRLRRCSPSRNGCDEHLAVTICDGTTGFSAH